MRNTWYRVLILVSCVTCGIEYLYLYHTAWEVKRSCHWVQIPCTPWWHRWYN